MRARWNRLRQKLTRTRISSEAAAFWAAIPLWVKWLAVGLAAVWALWYVPRWQIADIPVDRNQKPSDFAALENEFRKTLAQIVGGAFALVALYFTWRRVVAGDRTVRITEQGHITDRFTKAIEQLGKFNDDGQPNIEIRLGAIYALERIAFDSPRDHWTIMEVLTAYVRQNAPAVPRGELVQPRPRTDIQAIITVLGRRKRGPDREQEGQVLDLSQTSLPGAILRDAQLQRANFWGAQLQAAFLERAQLQKANLWGAQLQKANLWAAQLQEANLSEAQLQGADLWEAQLQGADFWQAQLQEADFWEAQLQGAHFLKPEQIKVARRWELGFYDTEFAALLGLTTTAKDREEVSNS